MSSLKKFLLISLAFFFSVSFILIAPPPSKSAEPVLSDAYNCTDTYFPQADDASFQLNLPFPLKLGQQEHSTVFVSTNGVMSFGVSDATFHDYPNTPSISLAGFDWVTWGEGGYLRYGTTQSTLCIQWAVRPFPQSTGPITNITLLVDRESNGSWTGQIITDGWLPDNLRRGIRYTPGEPVVVIDSTFRVGASGIPIETQTCWDGSVIPVTQDCSEPTPPEVLTREVQCFWTNPYTQEVVSQTANQRYNLYWDGRTEDIESVQTVCDAITPPTFIEPEPVLMERLVECSWTNPYTQEVVQGTAIQKYNTFWDGTTADVDSVETVCSNAAPIFIEPEPVLRERVVECVWVNPYTQDTVYGTATAQYNVYWDNSEIYVVSPEVACAIEKPIFLPVEYPANSLYFTASEGWDLQYVAPEGYIIDEILFASYGNSENYQFGWCHADNSLELVQSAVVGTTLNIGAHNGLFGDPCSGTYKNLSVVLTIKVDPDYIAPPTVECWDGSMVYDISECPIQPPPPPTYECWDGTFVYDVSECLVKPVEPEPTPNPEPTPTPTPSPTPTPTEEPRPVVPPVTPQQPSTVEELLNNLAEGETVSVEQLVELGIDYSELPPDTLVELENGVIITAEIADAIEIFEDPSELLMTVFTDPGKAVKALLNVGADLTPEKRKEVIQAAVPAIIVTQIAASTAAALATRRF
jgi:hypothetical protein